MNTTRCQVFLMLIYLLSSPAHAAPAEKEAPKDNVYEIEVLVFENRLPDLAGDELLGQEVAKDRLRSLDQAILPEPMPGKSYFQPVLADKMSRDGAYRILAHARWLQTLDPTSKAAVKPVRLTSASPGELDGTVRFTMSRFLHLDVNLIFSELQGASTGSATYRISEQRRVKSQETSYFDHPKFGALVRIVSVEKPPEATSRTTPSR